MYHDYFYGIHTCNVLVCEHTGIHIVQYLINLISNVKLLSTDNYFFTIRMGVSCNNNNKSN